MGEAGLTLEPGQVWLYRGEDIYLVLGLHSSSSVAGPRAALLMLEHGIVTYYRARWMEADKGRWRRFT